jgi:hypothetical protein
MFLSVDGGCSWIFNSDTSQGARHQCFLMLMIDAPRSLALATSQGVHYRRFLALVVDAPGSSPPAPPRGASSMLYNIDGGRS